MATSRSEAASLQLLSRIGSAGQLCLASRQPAAVRLRGITLRHHHNTNSTLQGHGIAAKRYSRGFSSNPVSALAAPTDTNRTKQKSNNVTTSSVPSSDGKRKIAVLGGGLTGLTAAHYLARHAPDAQITLFEASDTMGGWVQGREVDTTEGRVTMQSGPRMIRSMKSSNRYDDLVFYDVLASLDIDDQLKDVGQQAGTRYLYYPDHLVRLPGPPMTLDNIISTARSLYEEPLWDGLLPSVFNYFMKSGPQPPTPERRAAMDKDESVGHFLERLCGDDRLVKNVVSAMMHGIHGGDVYKLSAKHTLFNKLWYQTTGGGDKTKTWMPYKELSLLCDIMDGPNRAKVCELGWKGENSNMLAFDDGMLTLVHALEQDLQSQKQVKIKTQTPVTSLAPVDGGKVRLEYKSPKGTTSEQFDKVISTITAKQLSKLARPEGSLSVLGETHAVTIQVVNLWYPESGLLKDNPGFGFLVPVGTPNNDASLLGVIFDSEAQASDLEPGTKLTVMMGGHHWDGNTYLPTAEQGVEMAKNAVTKILGIPRMPGMLATERMCYECLPQHLVGHRKLMARAHEQLLQTFRGGLSVAGPSFTSAGVMPSMRAGYDAAMRVATQKTQPWPRVSLSDDQSWWSMLPEVENDQGYKVFRGDHIGETGLAAFTQPDGDTLERVSMEALFFRNNSSEAAGALDSHGKPTQWIGTPLIKYPQ